MGGRSEFRVRRAARVVAVFLLFVVGVAGCGSSGRTPEVSGFVELAGLRGTVPAPVELTGGAGEAFYRVLRGLAGKDDERARAALTAPRDDGTRTFAFVKTGCAETGAEPVVVDDVLDVELTGGEDTNCAAANHFLVTVRAKDTERRLRLPG